MIKDVVVNLSVGERASPAEDYALSVAATFAAHIAGSASATTRSFRWRAPLTPSPTFTVRVSTPATSPLK